MPNHCHNRVTIWSEDQATIENLKNIFEDEKIFTHFIPEPDWANTPLMTSENKSLFTNEPKGKDGELPMQPTSENGHHAPFFQSTGHADDRWYDWRVQNWDTKWDAYDVQVDGGYDDDEITVEFNTAWSPPEAICEALREQYPKATVQWFYDEPGCELAGYL